jgi:hypothetical protein
MILIVYDTYFEKSESKNEDQKVLPRITEKDDVEVFFNYNNTTIHNVYEPSIAIDTEGNYFISFITRIDDKEEFVWHSHSTNKEDWVEPKLIFEYSGNVSDLYLDYIESHFFSLTIKLNGVNYLTTSLDGLTWSDINKTELFIKNGSICYEDGYVIYINHLGVNIFHYENLNELGIQSNSQLVIEYSYKNPSILKIDDNRFLIVHENENNNQSSVIITTFELDFSEPTKDEIKWDILIIFLIMFLILIFMIIKEIAHD